MRDHCEDRIATGCPDTGPGAAVLHLRGSDSREAGSKAPRQVRRKGRQAYAPGPTKSQSPERQVPLSRDELIEAHLGLVVVIAKRHADRGVALADLIAEGNAGLVRAAARFDPERGIRFSSYAYPWIEHAIRAACMQYRDVITVPSAMKRLIYAYRRLNAAREPGNEITSADVAHELGIPLDAAASVMSAAAGPRATASQGDAYDAMKLLAAPNGSGPADSLETQDSIAAVASAMASLGPVERRVVAMHFGLEGHEPSTRAAIAAELKMLPECVDWTLSRALGRLRVLLGRQKVA